MTVFDDIVLGTGEPDPDRPVRSFSEAYHRLRPNEVAGTRDVDAINAIMREALDDDWASVFIPTGRVRPMLWSDYFTPDAPALGFYAEPIIGAEAVPDGRPPEVTTPDPVADLVKAYRLIEANPGYRPDLPGPDRWIRWSDVAGDGPA
jgi:hypothetical protein